MKLEQNESCAKSNLKLNAKCNNLTEKLIWLKSWLQLQQLFIIFRKLFYQNVWVRPTFLEICLELGLWWFMNQSAYFEIWNIEMSLACVDSISSSISESTKLKIQKVLGRYFKLSNLWKWPFRFGLLESNSNVSTWFLTNIKN